MDATLKLVPETSVISRRDRLTIPQIPAHSRPAIQSLVEALKGLNASPSDGPCIFVFHDFDGDPQASFDLEICLPVDPALRGPVPTTPITLTTLPPFRCLAADYVGGMRGIGAAWKELVGGTITSGHKPTRESREVYKKWIGFDSPENLTELQQGIE